MSFEKSHQTQKNYLSNKNPARKFFTQKNAEIMLCELVNNPDFKREVIKILLDKGIIAIIFVFISLYVSKLLERYKTKNAFLNSFSTFQVQGYVAIFECLMRHTISKKAFEIALREAIFMNSQPGIYDSQERSDAQKKLKEKQNQYADDLENLAGLVYKNLLFVSEDFYVKLNDYTSYMVGNSFIQDDKEAWIEKLSSIDSFQKLTLLQQLIKDEVEEKKKKPWK